MAVRLYKDDIEAIAKRVVELLLEQKDVPFVNDEDDWISAEEAAKILNISRGRVYQIKNHLTHRKGNTPQSRLYFKKSRLREDYLNI
jgi:DNA invertase Pin-like site-specific DNA recombinase